VAVVVQGAVEEPAAVAGAGLGVAGEKRRSEFVAVEPSLDVEELLPAGRGWWERR